MTKKKSKPKTVEKVEDKPAKLAAPGLHFDPEHPPVAYSRPCFVQCVAIGCPHIERCWKPKAPPIEA